jgi:hypothetical protein
VFLLSFAAVRRLSNLDYYISKIQIGRKRNGIQPWTRGQKMAYLERSRGKEKVWDIEIDVFFHS